MKIEKRGKSYFIKLQDKILKFKTLKGAKKFLKDHTQQQKQKQKQTQSVIVNINTGKAKPTARKALKSIIPPQTIRMIPSITPFTALEQYSNARPRSYNILPSEIENEEIKRLKNTINELREPFLKKQDIFIKPSEQDNFYQELEIAEEKTEKMGRGRPRLTEDQLIERQLSEWRTRDPEFYNQFIDLRTDEKINESKETTTQDLFN